MTHQGKFEPSPNKNEDPLGALLDDNSEDEFGLPEFRNHISSDNTLVVLRDWTAKEFASVYIRFKPHLERHARRYLNNQTQVEEVVQDAFLYLMTALPELDSELGVLRFLKWKTRLLALDVIRLNSRVAVSSIEGEDLISLEPEVSKGLERADDAAIVSMALAKLNPRHREVLLASLYQEKSTEDLSTELGLSENATRQLIFRARAAFKNALVGEAETAGLRVSEILSIAARKAKSDSLSIISSVGAVVLLIGSVFAFGTWLQPPVQIASLPTIPNPHQGLESSIPADGLDRKLDQIQSQLSLGEGNQDQGLSGDVSIPPSATAPSTEQPLTETSPMTAPEPNTSGNFDEPAPVPENIQPVVDSFDISFGRASLSSIQVSEVANESVVGTIEPVRIQMIDSQGRAIAFLFDINAQQIFSDIEVALSFDGILYRTLSLENTNVIADFEKGKFVFESSLGLLVDSDRNLLEDDSLNDAVIRVQLDTDEDLTRIKMYEASYKPGITAQRTI